MATLTVTDDTFDQEVLGADRPVLVDFWATWCAPCRMVAPVLEELSDEYADTVTIAKVDVDRSPMVAQRYGIRSIPTLVLFEDGEPKQAVQGALPKPQLVEFLERSVSRLAPPTITVEELVGLLRAEEPVLLLDVRAESDYHRAHLPKARHADPDALADRLAEASGPVVLVCRSGADSEALAKTHAQSGHDVRALQGGLLEWQGAGHDTFSTDEERAQK